MNETEDDRMHLSKPFRTIYTVFILTIMVIGVAGNTLVIVVILQAKNMRNSTNIFLANLAIADLLTFLVLGPTELVSVNSSQNVEDLGRATCYMLSFFRDTLIHVPVLTVLFISVERYYAVCRPMKAGCICTKKRAFKMCLFAWVLAAFSSSLQLSFLVFYPAGYINGSYHAPLCGNLRKSFLYVPYLIMAASVFYFLPLIILVVLYVQIAQHFKVAVASSINSTAMKHRHKVIKMLAAVVLCFFVFLLPDRVILLLNLSIRGGLNTWLGGFQRTNILIAFSQSMILLQSAVNPILYNLMSKRFREGFKNIFHDMLLIFNRWRSSCYSGRERTSTTTTHTNTLSN